MPFYTGKGDGGESHVYGRTASKDSAIFSAIGDVDELNSAIGVAIANISDDNVGAALMGVQNELFVIGAELAGYSVPSNKRTIGRGEIKELESLIDEYGIRVGRVERFVLPGGSIGASHLHSARAVARRAERSVVGLGAECKNRWIPAYLNRLSSMLFVMALYVNKKEGVEEAHPDY